jgi:O-antigen/teichoic acid export membrane protein
VSAWHAAIYLASRVASAIVNAAAVVVFTRMTSATLYGQYLIGFAFCFIIYSLGMQWAIYAHFGNYNARDGARLAGALLVVSAAFAVPALTIVGLLGWVGTLHVDVAWGSAALVVCLTAYFAALEIGRSHLLVGAVTAATLVRSVLSLALGVLALLWFDTPTALLTGVAIGYAAGAGVVFVALARTIWGSGFVWPDTTDVMKLMRYGWPLIFAFGASAAAMNIDRILLERLNDAATVAPYGAVLDFMKQTFLVVAESICVGYISFAKRLFTDGDRAGASDVLRRAFVTQWYLVVFGIVSFILLGDVVFGLLLAPSYLPVALQVLPVLVIANALLVLRAYHFGQVIYFSTSAKLEVAASAVMLVVTAAGGYLLIPAYGAFGAAIGFTLGQAAALLVYIVLTPKALRMPIDWPRATILAAVGVALLLVGKVLDVAVGQSAAAIADLVLLAASAGFFLLRWNLFDARVIAQRMRAVLTAGLSAP